MAHIEKSNDKGEISVIIGNTDSGIDYRFVLHGNHLVVEQGSQSFGETIWRESDNWYENLTEIERLHVFREVLAEYRERSLGDGNFKLAAIGITESGAIYVSENTELTSDDFHRQCAEQNMVTIAAQRQIYEQIKTNGARGENEKPLKLVYPRFREVYLMGGRLPEIPIACPCGNCTDLLAKVMDKKSNVWMLPVEAPQANGGKLSINDSATTAENLLPGEAWKTTIGHLNKDRVITLTDAAADEQRQAYEWLFDAVDEFMAEKPKRALDSAISSEDLPKEMYLRIGMTFVDHLDELARMAGYDGGIRHLDKDELKELAYEHIRWVRCVAIQRTDGEWAIEASGKSPAAKSLPPPETAALTTLSDRLASQGIRHMEVMECAPRHISAGTMRTSPKAALERSVKNRAKDGEELTMRFHGLCDTPTKDLHFDYMPREIFPSYFTGKKPVQLEAGKSTAPLEGERPINRVADTLSEGELAPKRVSAAGRTS